MIRKNWKAEAAFLRKMAKVLTNRINSLRFLDDDERKAFLLIATVLRERADKIEGTTTSNG